MEAIDIFGLLTGIAAIISGCILIAAGFVNQTRKEVIFGLLCYTLGLITIMIIVLERISS